MKTFIANFGQMNHLWPTCLARPSVATLEDPELRALWLAGDRAGYIDLCISAKKTQKGLTPTRQVASRWFNLAHIISSTESDLWIHREKDELWWTMSRADAVDVSLVPAFGGLNGDQVYVLHKPTEPWSNKTRKGNPLNWRALHPKAHEFLFTEGTLQELSTDNATYAKALIEGNDLTPWHSMPAWKAKAEASKKGPARVFSAKEISVARMADSARATVAAANGQPVVTIAKVKDLRFVSKQEFEGYIAALIEAQDGLCALTGLRLQFDGECDDRELRCSLDRIDSNGHYEDGNLQVVCWFANRWKSSGNDAEFRRLIGRVRTTDIVD
jgi:hypothetical protein